MATIAHTVVRHSCLLLCLLFAGAFTSSRQQQQQQQHVQPAVTVVSRARADSAPGAAGSYPGRQSVVLGVSLLVVAALSATFNTVDLVVTIPHNYYSSFGVAGHGLWGGLLVRTHTAHLHCLPRPAKKRPPFFF